MFRILNNEATPLQPSAFLGVRACELAAIGVQDRVLLDGRYRDPVYHARREGVFVVAVQCIQSAATFFALRWERGPKHEELEPI